MRTNKLVLAAIAAGCALALFAGSPAFATTGSVTIVPSGTANMLTFPCTGGCTDGVLQSSPVVTTEVGWAPTATISGNFSYEEPTCASGTAGGGISVVSALGTNTGTFTWARLGAMAVVQISITGGPQLIPGPAVSSPLGTYQGLAAFSIKGDTDGTVIPPSVPGVTALEAACTLGSPTSVTASVVGIAMGVTP